jgi:acyl-CoA dehydrogenase-like protein
MIGTSLRDDAQAQYSAAKAEALIESSGLNAKESFRPLWAKVVTGEPVPVEMRARVRRAVALAAESASKRCSSVIAPRGRERHLRIRAVRTSIERRKRSRKPHHDAAHHDGRSRMFWQLVTRTVAVAK